MEYPVETCWDIVSEHCHQSHWACKGCICSLRYEWFSTGKSVISMGSEVGLETIPKSLPSVHVVSPSTIWFCHCKTRAPWRHSSCSSDWALPGELLLPLATALHHHFWISKHVQVNLSCTIFAVEEENELFSTHQKRRHHDLETSCLGQGVVALKTALLQRADKRWVGRRTQASREHNSSC